MLPLLALALTTTAAEPLKLWHAYRGGEEQALEQSAHAFTLQTGIDVELLAVPYDAFSSKITSAVPHGAGPDVFIFAHERLRQFKRMEVVAPAKDQSLKSPADRALELDGVRYGYPLAVKCLALYRNVDLLPEPVRSTADFERMLRPLADAPHNHFGLAYEAGDFYYHAAILSGFGGVLFDANGRAQFDTPQMAASLRFVRSLQDTGLMPQEISGALVKSLFNDRRVPLVISGPWFAGEIDPTLHYTVDPLPVVSETGLPMRPFLGVEAAFVSSQAHPHADELARFIADNPEARVKLGRQIPPVAQLNEDDPLVLSFTRAAALAVPTPNTLEMARVWEPMKLALRGVLQGTVAPDQAGALADRRYRALNRESPGEQSPLPWELAGGAVLIAAAIWVARRPRPSTSFAHRYPDTKRALVYVGPAAVGIAVLVMIPFAVGLSLSLFHHDAGHYTFVGLGNFKDILSSHGYAITEPLSFYFTLAVTILWTATNVALHVSIGLALALLLKSPLLRLRGIFRMLLIVPWAVPNYITALMWKGLFHRQFGAINGVLALFGVEPISWFTRFSTAFAANVATNTWLGFPFMMGVALGALQSISTGSLRSRRGGWGVEVGPVPPHHAAAAPPCPAARSHPRHRVDVQHVQRHLPGERRRARRSHRHSRERGVPLGVSAQRAIRLRGRVLGAHLSGAVRLVARHEATLGRCGMKLRAIALHGFLALVCAITLYPVMWVVKMALSPTTTLALSANPLPQHVTLQHFHDVIFNTDLQGRWLFGRQLLASVTVATASTLVGLTLAVTAAYAISRFRFPGKEAGLQALLVTQMFPATLMLVPIYSLLQMLHLLDTWTGLILVYSTTSLPFCVWMLKGYFDALPKELEEAALMDGASPTQVFFKVVLPLSRPALAVTALFSFMQAWNEFILAATLLDDTRGSRYRSRCNATSASTRSCGGTLPPGRSSSRLR